MLGRDTLESTLLTCDQDNFDQITARSWNRTLVSVVRDTCNTTGLPTPHITTSYSIVKLKEQRRNQKKTNNKMKNIHVRNG